MKAGVSLLEGNDFVCFWLSTCLLALRKEVGGVREQMEVMESELMVTREKNEKLKSLVVQKGSEKLGVNEEGPVDAGVESELVTEDKVRKSQITDGKNMCRNIIL